MSFFKVATLAVAIMSSYCPISEGTSTWEDNYKECTPKCKEDDLFMRIYGNATCVMRKVDGEDSPTPSPMSKCRMECMGEEPAENQTKCLVDLCKHFGTGAIWCTGVGKGGIKFPEECDTLVATGEAKLHGDHICNPRNMNPRY